MCAHFPQYIIVHLELQYATIIIGIGYFTRTTNKNILCKMCNITSKPKAA